MELEVAAFSCLQYFFFSKRQVVRVRVIAHTGRGAVLQRDRHISRWDDPLPFEGELLVPVWLWVG